MGRKWLGPDPSADQDLATKEYVDDGLAGKASTFHTHDDRYYTETEVDALLANAGGGGVSVSTIDVEATTTVTTDALIWYTVHSTTLTVASDGVYLMRLDADLSGNFPYSNHSISWGLFSGTTELYTGTPPTGVTGNYYIWNSISSGAVLVRLSAGTHTINIKVKPDNATSTNSLGLRNTKFAIYA